MNPQDKVVSLTNLACDCFEKRKSGQTIVLTHGCFDLLHSEHLLYLLKAKEQGDFLVVGINSDQFVRRLKGPDRPLRNQADRAFLIAGLEVVDAVVVFESRCDLIREIEPDVYVVSNTSNVSIDQDPSRAALLQQLGTKVVTLGSKQTVSTTKLIKKMSQ